MSSFPLPSRLPYPLHPPLLLPWETSSGTILHIVSMRQDGADSSEGLEGDVQND